MRSIARFAVCILLGLAVFLGGCLLRPRLAARGLVEHESVWAQTIERSYPGWKPPYMAPVISVRQSPEWGTAVYDSRAAVIAPPAAAPVHNVGPAFEEGEIELIPVDGGGPSLPTGGTTYTVKQGDTLQSISEKTLGDQKHWEKLLKRNQRVLSNPHQLRPGMVLELPSL